MAGTYRLDFINASGVRYAQVVDFLELALTKKVNSPGALQFALLEDHRVLSQLAQGDIVELWRKDPVLGIPWTLEFGGRFAAFRANWPNEDGGSNWGAKYRDITVLGYAAILAERIVAWEAGTVGRSRWDNTKAQTIAWNLAHYNAGPGALSANGRLLDGVVTGMSVQVDGANGPSLWWACAYRNLLEALQELSDVGNGDFDIVRTTGANLEFRWYNGQRGTDRRATLTFSTSKGNMRNPVWEYSQAGEKTVAVVAGGGQGNTREVVIRQGEFYQAGTRHREMYVDARDVSGNTTLLSVRGDARLKETKPLETFEFEVVQTEAVAYGRDYFLGDLGKAVNPYNGTLIDVKVEEVGVSLAQNGDEEIKVRVTQLGDPYSYSPFGF
jgi:hypothetical protein